MSMQQTPSSPPFGRRPQSGDFRATVLQVLPALAAGGVERGTVEIAAAIVKAGGRALVASAGGPMVHDVTRAGASHVQLPLASKNPWRIRRNIKLLEDLIRAESVEIIHARSRAPAWSAYFAAKWCQIRFVTTFHGTYGAASYLKRRYNAVMTRGDRVIAISRHIADHMGAVYGVAGEKVRLIHRGVDTAVFDPAKVSAERMIQAARAWQLPDGAPVVLLPGRLTRWKGQIPFIDAAAQSTHPDALWVMVGSDQGRRGYRAELEKRIADHGLQSRVWIVEHSRDMAAVYMLATVVVSPSIEPEAFGRTVIEGQAMGRAVVATDHGGPRESMIAGQTGWLVPPGDAAALADAVDTALDLDAGGRAALAGRAIENVRRHFTTTAMCARTLDVYRDLLA